MRVRRSQLDAFLAAGETGEQAERDSWQAVRAALATVTAAVDHKDPAALETTISELAEAAREVA